MAELLRPGARGWMVPFATPGHRTAGQLVAVEHAGTLVSLDTQAPNRLVGRWLATEAGRRRLGVPAGAWRAEARFGRSRLDFAILGERPQAPRALLEVKSANLRVGGEARFPDAPTVRGVRHLQELAEAARRGIDATVLFVVQRGDCRAVGPHRALDPAFGRACDLAARAGVRFRAVRLRVRPDRLAIGADLPVLDLGE